MKARLGSTTERNSVGKWEEREGNKTRGRHRCSRATEVELKGENASRHFSVNRILHAKIKRPDTKMNHNTVTEKTKKNGHHGMNFSLVIVRNKDYTICRYLQK